MTKGSLRIIILWPEHTCKDSTAATHALACSHCPATMCGSLHTPCYNVWIIDSKHSHLQYVYCTSLCCFNVSGGKHILFWERDSSSCINHYHDWIRETEGSRGNIQILRWWKSTQCDRLSEAWWSLPVAFISQINGQLTSSVLVVRAFCQ